MSKPTSHQAQHETGNRAVTQIFEGIATSDGAGVRMRRFIGTEQLDQVDPFLMLDIFKNDRAQDYMAGFPDHPHRGFETITYMLAGKMRHKDNAGHEGVIEAGGLQWMTAGRGIIHSEMPEQEDGLMWGSQLWLNLPREEKMTAPRYAEFNADQIPSERRPGGVRLKVLAGTTSMGTEGAVGTRSTQPFYLDVSLPGKAALREPLPTGHGAFIYVLAGELAVVAGGNGENQDVRAGNMAVLGRGTRVELLGIADASRFLLVAGKALNEPMARGGPFVMNTRAELYQAFRDYQSGNF